MNKPLAVSLATLFALPAVAETQNPAEAERLVVNFNYDEDGGAQPDTFVPLKWSENLYSGLGYSQVKYSRKEALENFSTGKNQVNIDEQRYRLELLNYEDAEGSFRYSFGAQYSYLDIKKNEFGYVESGGSLIVFDNRVDIEVHQPSIRGDMSWRSADEGVLLRLGANVSPYNRLTVDQATDVKPQVSQTGKSQSTTQQDPAYGATLEVQVRTPLKVDLGVVAGYEFLPLNYDLAVLNSSGNGFVEEEQDTEQETLSYGVRLVLRTKLIGEARPVLGWRRQEITTHDNNADASQTTETDQLVIGFENRF